MAITQLPEDVVAQIKSSVVITSLNSVVFGLLKNSLDAEASKITVSVDYRLGNCSVEDNGHGIPPQEFKQHGGLGQLHHTSNYPHRPDRYGKYGTFLAATGTLSLLSIKSRHYEYASLNSLTMHNSHIVSRNTPALPEQRGLTFTHGTRITIRDLFGSMPVRVKHRALQNEKVGSAKEFDQLVLDVIALLLSWFGEVSVSLRDNGSGQVVKLQAAGLDQPLMPKKDDEESRVILRTRRLLAQASLVEESDVKSWVSVEASGSGVIVSGCVCLTPVATKRLQFLSIGMEPLIGEHQSNVFYDEINRAFANSAFGSVEDEVHDTTQDTVPSAEGFNDPGIKMRKGLDRWPMFNLQIRLQDPQAVSHTTLQNGLDCRDQTFMVITNLLRTLSCQFLEKHHFRPRPINKNFGIRTSNHNSSPIPQEQSRTPSSRCASRNRAATGGRAADAGRQVSRPSSPFDLWSRVKVGRPSSAIGKPSQQVDHVSLRSSPSPRIRAYQGTDQAGRDGGIQAADSAQCSHVSSDQTAKENDTQNSPRDNIDWVDPVTNIRSTIDSRTGVVVESSHDPLKRMSFLPSKGNMTKLPSPSSPWIKDILNTWENPAFRPVEAAIPHVRDISQALESRSHSTSLDGGLCDVEVSNVFGADGPSLQTSISKGALRGAEIIGQVDNKFILVNIKLDSSTDGEEPSKASSVHKNLLVLIDQHAADERCRVEQLLESYFTSDQERPGLWATNSAPLKKELVFELTQKEIDLLYRFRDYFARWGILFEVVSDQKRASRREQPRRGPLKVKVHSLPPSILERCRLEPRLLVDILRKEIWKLESEPNLATMSTCTTEGDQGPGWVKLFNGCPQGILDLINSRACRSAIMFNDVLSLEQCRDLVKRLTTCTFPFQCAHGRPSMVPLLDIGNTIQLDTGLSGRGDDKRFWQELRRWM